MKARLDEDIKYFNELCARAESYKELKQLLSSSFNESAEFKEKRKEIVYKLAGLTDGHSAKRIVSYLEEHQ